MLNGLPLIELTALFAGVSALFSAATFVYVRRALRSPFAALAHVRDEAIAYAEQHAHKMTVKFKGAAWTHVDKKDAALAYAERLVAAGKLKYTRDQLSEAIEAGLGRVRVPKVEA